MSISALEIVTAGKLRALQPTPYFATASSDMVGSTSNVDVTGATLTFNTTYANAIYTAFTVFDFDTVSTGTTTAGTGGLMVDGVTQSAQAIFQAGAATGNDRSTVSQIYSGTLPSTGSHTIKLRVVSLPANMEINATHTNLLVVVYEVA